MVVMTGAELFTGNTFFLPLALLEKRASLGQVLKSWMFSYLGNVVGCLLLVSAVAQTGLLADLAGPTKVAVMKTSLSTSQVHPNPMRIKLQTCQDKKLSPSRSKRMSHNL